MPQSMALAVPVRRLASLRAGFRHMAGSAPTIEIIADFPDLLPLIVISCLSAEIVDNLTRDDSAFVAETWGQLLQKELSPCALQHGVVGVDGASGAGGAGDELAHELETDDLLGAVHSTSRCM